MNKNRKYAIVFGIFALVIVTTGVSFAFFTYSRTGETTTTITSGDIEFSFIEGSNASLTDAFPVSDSVGANDATGEYTFDVKMSSSSQNNKMSYNVYLIDDNKGSDKYFSNEQIEFALIKNGTYVAGTASTTGKKLTDVTGFTTGQTTGEGLVLENQEIIANSRDSYKLRIWISDDVDYSNTIDENGTMTGKFNGYKYSLKVKVTSGVETTTTVSEPVGRVVVANLADANGISAYAVTNSSTAPVDGSSEWISVTNESSKSGVVRTATGVVTSKTIQHKVDSYGTYYVHTKNSLNEVTTKSVEVKIKEVSKDTSGAATPVITGNLVPVILNGSDVIKADTTKGWYNYDQAIWANAVILEDNVGTYNVGDIIPEEAIESYFVWIPRYEYKIFNEGNYTETLTEKGDATQEIAIKFVTKEDEVQNGSTVGTWLTHPAFTSFDSNGMWVGKFESGYRGATTTAEAQKNVIDSSKLIIKPNVYSWRSIKVANAYQTSFDYNREILSHMMKNTEWGAVAYLSHSKYGNMNSIRINNNSAYVTGYSATEEPTLGDNDGTSISENTNETTALGVDGKYTINYLNVNSVLSSTTGNYSGIYDMSGGTNEHVMGVMFDSDGIPISGRHNQWNSGFKGKYGCPTCTSDNITGIDSSIIENTTGVDFPTDKRYFDIYVNSSNNKFMTRILGDATGEMGPFYREIEPSGTSRKKSYWYGDSGNFVSYGNSWYYRGFTWKFGSTSGVFSFNPHNGSSSPNTSFRVVLTPQE